MEQLKTGFYDYSFTVLVSTIQSLYPDADIRFRSHLSLAYPTDDVEQVVQSEKSDNVTELLLNFFRLAVDAADPFPVPFIQHVLSQRGNIRQAMIDFLDQFTHRTVDVLFRVLSRMEPIRHGATIENEPFSAFPLSLLGLGTDSLQNRSALEDRAVIGLGGFFLQNTRSFVSLEQAIASYFQVETRIEPAAEHFFEMMPDDVTLLDTDQAGQNTQLGINTVLGKQAWLADAACRVHLGPFTDFETYSAFLPGAEAYQQLQSLVHLYLSPEQEFELILYLPTELNPRVRLGEPAPERVPQPKLGWNVKLSAPAARLPKDDMLIRRIPGDYWTDENGALYRLP